MIFVQSYCLGGSEEIVNDRSYYHYIALNRSGIVQRLCFSFQHAPTGVVPELTIKKNGVQDIIQPVDLSVLQDGMTIELLLSENRDDLLLAVEDKIHVTYSTGKQSTKALNPTITTEINLDRVE